MNIAKAQGLGGRLRVNCKLVVNGQGVGCFVGFVVVGWFSTNKSISCRVKCGNMQGETKNAFMKSY